VPSITLFLVVFKSLHWMVIFKWSGTLREGAASIIGPETDSHGGGGGRLEKTT
jgi:hypothetical protein